MRFIEIQLDKECHCDYSFHGEYCKHNAEYAIRLDRKIYSYCPYHALEKLNELVDEHDKRISGLMSQPNYEENYKELATRNAEERKRCEDAIKELEKE